MPPPAEHKRHPEHQKTGDRVYNRLDRRDVKEAIPGHIVDKHQECRVTRSHIRGGPQFQRILAHAEAAAFDQVVCDLQIHAASLSVISMSPFTNPAPSRKPRHKTSTATQTIFFDARLSSLSAITCFLLLSAAEQRLKYHLIIHNGNRIPRHGHCNHVWQAPENKKPHHRPRAPACLNRQHKPPVHGGHKQRHIHHRPLRDPKATHVPYRVLGRLRVRSQGAQPQKTELAREYPQGPERVLSYVAHPQPRQNTFAPPQACPRLAFARCRGTCPTPAGCASIQAGSQATGPLPHPSVSAQTCRSAYSL